ncbi:MAG TPA: DUF167 domain-containing protein [Candidatus Paceibacterota bacterium]|nr:DUF167 domain-containing protein [Candidatus Paceibacterota bacterium]
MRIRVKAKPRSRSEGVEQLTQPTLGLDTLPQLLVYKVSVKESPVDGRANEAIVRLLAKHFRIPTRAVRIISGHASTQKVVEVALPD